LRVGPWKIERRDRLVGLRDLARAESEKGETRLEFALRFGARRPVAEEDDPALQTLLEVEARKASPPDGDPDAAPDAAPNAAPDAAPDGAPDAAPDHVERPGSDETT
jgi:hypothetical protein